MRLPGSAGVSPNATYFLLMGPEGHGHQAKEGPSSAAGAGQQSPGWRGARSALRNPGLDQAKKQALKGRVTFPDPPFQGSKSSARLTQGFGRFAASPWAVLTRAFSAGNP